MESSMETQIKDNNPQYIDWFPILNKYIFKEEQYTVYSIQYHYLLLASNNNLWKWITFIQVCQVEKVVFIENRVCNKIFEVCSRVNLHHQYIFIMLALKEFRFWRYSKMFKNVEWESGSRILCISRLLHWCQSKPCLPLDQVKASFSTLTITVSARNKHFTEHKTEQTLKFDTDAFLMEKDRYTWQNSTSWK